MNSRIKLTSTWRLACLAAAAALVQANAQAVTFTPKLSCEKLQGLNIPASQIRLPTSGATVTGATLIPEQETPGSANYLPEYCEISGEIHPIDPRAGVIHFGLAAPTKWNGNSLQIGGNGMLGFVPWLAALNRDGAGSPAGPPLPPSAPYPLARGYATYGDDSGYRMGEGKPPGAAGGVPPNSTQATMGGAPPVFNFDWISNRETWFNFTYEHIRKDHDTVMAVLKTMYGRSAKVSYFGGESHGGREAIEAIGRYPEDYDGVLVSVPLVYLNELFQLGIRNLKAEAAPGAWIPAAKLKVIEAEVQRQCDGLDGRQDGLVLNYAACTKIFDPRDHPHAMDATRCPDGKDSGNDCLSDSQIQTVNTFRSPLKLGYEMPGHLSEYPGDPVGAEATLNWVAARTQPDPAKLLYPFIVFYQHLLKDSSLTVASFDPVKLAAQLQKISEDLDAPADWSRFFAKGGKVIYASASDDYTTNANAHIAMYEAVVKQSGQAAADKAFRFYVTPSGDHGSRSFNFPDKIAQPRQMDLIMVLTDWVEAGKTPPDAIKQASVSAQTPYNVAKSRPLCRYPKYPRYVGKGDPNDFAAYICTAP